MATTLPILRWLIRDTFRQARASGIHWLMLALNVLAILFCLTVSVTEPQALRTPGEPSEFMPRKEPVDPAKTAQTGVQSISGELELLFGAVRVPMFRDGASSVRFLQVILAKWVAGTAGTLLMLIWTAGFLPGFLEPSNATVLLAKPTPRWTLLVGKFLGVMTFVAVHAGIFILGTWLALGLRTGVLAPGYILSYPLVLLNFLALYSASVLLAVCTRSTIVCVFGSILFWLVCYGMNYGRHALHAMPFLDPSTGQIPMMAGWIMEIGYWCLPKPADLTIMLDNLLQSQEHFPGLREFEIVQEQGLFYPTLSILTSLAFCVLGLVISARQLEQTDY